MNVKRRLVASVFTDGPTYRIHELSEPCSHLVSSDSADLYVLPLSLVDGQNYKRHPSMTDVFTHEVTSPEGANIGWAESEAEAFKLVEGCVKFARRAIKQIDYPKKVV